MAPKELRYTRTHEWIRAEGELFVVGITDYAAKQLSDLVYIELPDPDDDVLNDVPFGSVESVKAVEDLYCPVEGRVAEVNTELLDNPDLVTKDPYGKGWMIKVRPDPETPPELDQLLTADEYEKLVAEQQQKGKEES